MTVGAIMLNELPLSIFTLSTIWKGIRKRIKIDKSLDEKMLVKVCSNKTNIATKSKFHFLSFFESDAGNKKKVVRQRKKNLREKIAIMSWFMLGD